VDLSRAPNLVDIMTHAVMSVAVAELALCWLKPTLCGSVYLRVNVLVLDHASCRAPYYLVRDSPWSSLDGQLWGCW
jgi:hypothetical protein